jgi:LPS-assembly protein
MVSKLTFSWGLLILGLVATHATSAAEFPDVLPAPAKAAVTNSTEQGPPAIIDADKLTFDKATNMAVGSGNVTVRYRDAFLRADQVRLNTLTKEVWAEGNVRLNRAKQEWAAPFIYYNFQTRALKMDEARVKVSEAQVSCREIRAEGTNVFQFGKTTVTTCDYDHPHYRFEAKRAEVYPGDRVVLHDVVFRLGNVPMFWVPMMSIPLEGGFEPFTLDVGSDTQAGIFVLTRSRLKLNSHVTWTLLADERTRHGPGVGLQLDYKDKTNWFGMAQGYYTYDREPHQFYNGGNTNDIPYNRYRAVWQHKQFLNDRTDISANINKLSDQYVIDDFFHREYVRESEQQSMVSATKRGDQYMMSALVRPQLNRFWAEVERLPEGKWDVNRLRIFQTPVYYESSTSAGFYRNIEGDTGDPIYDGHSTRADTFHQLSSPQQFFGWLNLTPRAGFRYTYYGDTPDYGTVSNAAYRLVGNLGAETSFKLSRTWNGAKSKLFHIDGIRHIMEPFANYQWVPEPNVASQDLYQFDTPRSIMLSNNTALLVTRYLPFEFPAYNTTDFIDRQSAVRFGLRQRLQTRRDGKPWDLIELAVWDEYRAAQNPGQNPFSELFGTARVRPLDWLAAEGFVRYNWYTGQMDELNTAVHFNNGDRWSVGVGTRYLRGDSDVISGNIAYRLARGLTAVAYVRVDIMDGTWEEQNYMLRQETHDWFVDYGFRWRGQRTGPDDVTGYVALTLKAFPSFRIGTQ